MQRKIKVLFLFEGLYDRGAERVALELISGLDRERFDPRVWILRSVDDLRDQMPTDVEVHVALPPNRRIRHQLARVPLGLLREAARADVIVATVELMPTYFGYLAGLLTGKPVVGWVHNSLDQTFAEQARIHTWLARWLYPRLPQIVFVSHGNRQTLQTLMPLRKDRLSVIHNPINLARVRALAQEALPPWAAFMTERPTVLGAGRLVRQKGFDRLIEAHAALRARGIPHDLLIVGEGGSRPELEALARRLGVADSVHLPGQTANPYSLMRHAAAFALSSRYEGLAMVIVEALACGVPVVAFDCPSGPSEILEGGQHGLLVPADDRAALADGLATLLRGGELRERLREAGLRRVQDFAPEQVVPTWEALLRGVAGRGTGRGVRTADVAQRFVRSWFKG